MALTGSFRSHKRRREAPPNTDLSAVTTSGGGSRGGEPFKMCVDSILVISEAVTDEENLARSLSSRLWQGCGNHERRYPKYRDHLCNFGKHHIGECTR